MMTLAPHSFAAPDLRCLVSAASLCAHRLMLSRWIAMPVVALVMAAHSIAVASDLAESAIHAAAAYPASRSGAGVLVIQHGKTLLATNPREAHRIYSGTKGFWMLAALAAAQEGIISLD